MPKPMKTSTIYPGERRILAALMGASKTFTELKAEARLDGTTLSGYLKRLVGARVIEKDLETGKYFIPRALHPLVPKSFPKGAAAMETLIQDIEWYGDAIKGLKDSAERGRALEEFLHIHFSLLAGNLVMAVNEACGHEDPSVADEFLQRSLETYFSPWTHLLGMVCFRSKEISEKPLDQVAATLLKIAEDTYGDFLRRFPSDAAPDSRA